jgi:hypothetical protein
VQNVRFSHENAALATREADVLGVAAVAQFRTDDGVTHPTDGRNHVQARWLRET